MICRNYLSVIVSVDLSAKFAPGFSKKILSLFGRHRGKIMNLLVTLNAIPSLVIPFHQVPFARTGFFEIYAIQSALFHDIVPQ